MKTVLMLSFATLCLVAGWTIVAWFDQDEKQEPQKAEALPADQCTYVEVIPGVERAVLWGDPDRGAYGAFTRMKPGFTKERHTHSSDIRMIVLRGAYIYGGDAGEVRVGKDSYFLLPANTPHTTAADEKEGALFYEESPGKFDLNPSK